MDKVIIVTGGNRDIQHYRAFKALFPSDTFIIGVDAGATWLIEHEERLDLAIGDFDTIGASGLSTLKNANVAIITALVDKDETDTELALTEALQNNAKYISIYGGIGTRADHSLANMHLLWKCIGLGVQIQIIDPWNRIRMVEKQMTITKDYSYVSLFPFTPMVEGITLVGFKYPLQNATLQWGNSLGVSNELVDEIGYITVNEGALLVIESND